MESASCSKRGSWEIDLDKCRDKVTGEVSEWALDLVRRGDCYTEVSPSGTGLKMFMMADLEAVRSLPEFAGQKRLRKQAPYGTGRVEVYDKSSNRFFTVTGHRFGDVTTIEDRQEQFNDVYKTVFANLGGTKHQEQPEVEFAESSNGADEPDWLKEMCAEEDAREKAGWLKKFKGNLRTLDVVGLWRAAGLVIEQKDDETVRCPVSQPGEPLRPRSVRRDGPLQASRRIPHLPLRANQVPGRSSSALERRCCPSVLSLWTTFVNHFILTAMMMAICPRSSRIIANCPI